MAVATLRGLRAPLEVVVFPADVRAVRVHVRRRRRILLVARAASNHRGEEASLLADAVLDLGGRRRPGARGDRQRSRRRGTAGRGRQPFAGRRGSGGGMATATATREPQPHRRRERPMPTSPDPSSSFRPDADAHARPKVRVSPLRGGGVTVTAPAASVPARRVHSLSAGLPASAFGPSEPLSAAPRTLRLRRLRPGPRGTAALPMRREPLRPVASAAPTAPLEAPEAGVLQVRFTRGAETRPHRMGDGGA